MCNMIINNEIGKLENQIQNLKEELMNANNELEIMELKYLNALASQKNLKVVRYEEFYNIIDEDGDILNYTECEELIDQYILYFEEVEEEIRKY